MTTNIYELIKEMTLEEKASLLGGGDFWRTKEIARLEIPSFMMSDGPHGLRKQEEKADHLGINGSIEAVCFPSACATASSFDTDLIREMGEIIGNECQAEDLPVVLGPGVNIKRNPLCGRNFEYFSEDPYLTGKMAAAYINGVQSRHVGTSIKHFALNNQETNRMTISSKADERTIREIYFPAFEMAIKESQPKTIMCSYNKVNGVYNADNEWLLDEVLRGEWEFEGFVVTDWGAVNDRVQGVRAGLDLEMPGNTFANDCKIVEAVKNGSLDEKLLDQAVLRILRVFYDYLEHRDENAVFDRDADHKEAVRIEEESAVLLENNGILPLKGKEKVAYIGEFAVKPRYQGGGSSHINASKVSSAFGTAQEKGRDIIFAKGFPDDKDEENADDFAQAIQAAQEADVAVIFAGLPEVFESEGYDRKNMNLPDCQNRLIEEITKVQPHTVVVLHNGSPIEAPWADSVEAVLEMYLGGQGIGEATDRILYGETNPSGHLAETFPLRVQDNPSYLNFPGDGYEVNYAEGVYVGYRYYDTKEIPVRWAFGHGLSYTTFQIDNIRLSSKDMTDDSIVDVSVDITNTGDLAGKAVVQLYISDENGTAGRPIKELKGFKKIFLSPGEKKTVTMPIDARALSYYHTDLHGWFAPSGKYRIIVGDASDHICAETALNYKTNKLLPMHIDGATTIEKLLSDPRTHSIAQRMSDYAKQKVSVKADDGEGMDVESEEIRDAMILYMPIKSMMSLNIMSEEKLNDFVKELKAVVGQ